MPDLLAGKPAPLQTFSIDSARARWLAGNHHVGRHILADTAVHAEKRVIADSAELVSTRVAGEK